MTQFAKYFTLKEFTDSETAARHGLDNTPPAQVVTSLHLLCQNILDPLREALNRPIQITSGYRSPQVNHHASGARSSQHLVGEAADFKVQGMTPEQVFEFIRASDLPFDQAISEFGQWVHVSYSARKRGQCLIASKVNGHTHYQQVARLPITHRAQAQPVHAAQSTPANLGNVKPEISDTWGIAPSVLDTGFHTEPIPASAPAWIDRMPPDETAYGLRDHSGPEYQQSYQPNLIKTTDVPPIITPFPEPSPKEISPQLIGSGVRTAMAVIGGTLGALGLVDLSKLQAWVNTHYSGLVSLIGGAIVLGQFAWSALDKYRSAKKLNQGIAAGLRNDPREVSVSMIKAAVEAKK